MIEVRTGNLNKATDYLEEAVLEKTIDKSYIKNKEFEKAVCFMEKFPFVKSRMRKEIFLYLSKKLNIFDKELASRDKNLSYGKLQLLDYDEFVAIEYINKNSNIYNFER